LTSAAKADNFYTVATQQIIIPILISIVVFLFAIGCGAAIWFLLRQRSAVKPKGPSKQATRVASLSFHWSYIVLPASILLLSVILIVFFYQRLPAEVGYHFESDGSPDRWLSRGAIVLWMLLPQLFLTLLAGAITWGISRLSAMFRQPESTWVKPEHVLLLMGNIIALPQAVICFAMLDIFSYNSYQVHLIPVWVFAVIIMVLGGIFLGIFFIRAMLRAWQATR